MEASVELKTPGKRRRIV